MVKKGYVSNRTTKGQECKESSAYTTQGVQNMFFSF